MYGGDGKLLKKWIRMQDAMLEDGTPQPLYFPPGHMNAGLFKGMSVILAERNLIAKSKLRAQCKNFKCADTSLNAKCCCRRVLYNQPDFIQIESLLETTCKARGFEVLFLPKFHCELNFIEQCWGYAKRIYRHYPASSKEADLERNILSALESVPLTSMRRYGISLTLLVYSNKIYSFAIRSFRFMDAYSKGLSGKQAAWAAKKYHGHRVLPDSIMRELFEASVF